MTEIQNSIKNKFPKISVVTPSFNQAKFIEQTINSVLMQSYPNFEHIIIDGGSKDGTIEILKKYPHLKWISEKDKGQADALNKGIKLTTGEIIAWINSDDWYEANTFFTVAKFFEDNQNKNVVMGDCNLVDENGKVFDRVINYERGFEELKNYRTARSIPTQPAIYFRKKLLKESGLLDISLKYVMDYDLWLRFAKENRFFHIDKTFANYRFHKDAKIGDQNWEKIYPECETVKQRYVSVGESPMVSVIIPCYNYAHYLPEAVESVINQTYKNFEIIIVNDGSTDNSKEVAENLINQNSDYNIKLIDQKNTGHPSASRNNGIVKSKGNYIVCLDADDKLAPNALTFYLEAIPENKGDFVVFGWLKSYGDEESVWNSYPFEKNDLLRRNMVPSPSLFTKSVWLKQGGYRLNGYEDWDFWIGAAKIGANFINVPKILTLYRKTNNESRIDKDISQHENNIAAIILNHKEIYENLEVAWATNFMNNPNKYKFSTKNYEYTDIAALWISQYPEHYSDLEVNWAKNFINKQKFEFKTGIKSITDSSNKLKITAIISAYNEGDIIFHVVKDLVEQNIQVYFIDHHSNDNTVQEVSKFLGNGVIKIEKFPEESNIDIPNDVYSWRYILQRKEQISLLSGKGWYIHADADEFREAPWANKNLREGIEKVDAEGYNAIDFKIYDFKPTSNNFVNGADVRKYLTHYSTDIHKYNNIQVKCWKNFGQGINLWQSGGHSVDFEGRNVYPIPFILRHYAIRSQAHGLKKIFNERKNRYDTDERKARWHEHYDEIKNEKHKFIESKSKLINYVREKACIEILNEFEKQKNDYYGFSRPEVQTLVNKGSKKILDVGCAGGKMASELKQSLNAEVWGVEYVDSVAKLAAKKLDKVLSGSIEDAIIELPEKYFDSIIFADVLEHLRDPEEILKKIKSKISDNGEIIVSLPNIRHWSVLKELLQGRWDYQEAGILDRTHLRFFTKDSIVKMFTRLGFNILDIRATLFDNNEVSDDIITILSNSGLDVSTLKEESRHYQYLLKLSPKRVNLKLTAVIPVFNQLEYTKQMMDSFFKSSSVSSECIIIDNAGKIETVEYLRALSDKNSNVKIIRNNDNLGFPMAINQGLAESSSDYILIANNDIIIPPGAIERMIDIAEGDLKIGIVGPISNKVSGVQLDKNANYETLEEMHEYAGKIAKKNCGKVLEFPRVAFLCTLIKREVIEKIGGLDENFSPGNYEDDDFCLRTQLSGYKTVIAKDVFIHHYGSKSFKADGNEKYKKLLETNKQKFIDKWGATPDDIWLHNVKPKNPPLYLPIEGQMIKIVFEQAMKAINEEHFKEADSYLEECLRLFDDFSSNNINKNQIIELREKISKMLLIKSNQT